MENAGGDQAMGKRARFWRKTLTDLAVMTVIGVFLAIIGPFGSIQESLPVRLLNWLAFAYAGYAIYSPMGLLVERAHRALALPVAPLWLAAVLVATVPMTALVFVVQYMPNWPPVPDLDDALTSYFYVFVIGGGITLLFNVLGLDRRLGAVASAPAATPEPIRDRIEEAVAQKSPSVVSAASDAGERPNPLFDQLPPELGSDVIALEMEDHYVRVHTALGSDLVLMRLRDAMAYLSGIEGRQVHRSWWVAKLAVQDVKREGRNVRLVLDSGLEAPVSRTQVNELRQAGWI